MSVFTFISNHDDSQHSEGSIVWEDVATCQEADILHDLQDIGALMTYIASQFPHGWRIENGKVVSEPIKCFVCEESHPAVDMTEFHIGSVDDDSALHMCPGCKDIHWKEYS